jgi:hypothetical protein
MTERVENDPLARQLVQQAQLISRLRHDLDQLASEITDAYADVLTRFESLDDRPSARSGTPNAWCWRSLGEQGRDELWSQLKDWVDWIRHRYPLAKKIPTCWAEHPELVEELTALWLAWQAAYEQPDAQLTAAADWHDRWLPGLLHRLEHGPHAINCGDGHHPRPATAYGTRRANP